MKTMNMLLALCGILCLGTACGGGDDDNNGIDTSIKVSAQPTSFTVGAEGGTYELSVSANRDWSAFPTNGETWIKVDPSSGMSGDIKVTVTIAANDTYEPREGQITVKAGTERQFLAVTQAAGERPAELYPCPIEGYSLVWNDEFDDEGILDGDWTYEVQKDHWVNNELQNYVYQTSPGGKEVASVKSGILSINCFKENGKIYSGRVYGHRNKGFRYCYIEASICLPSGKGTWPAFWMMPVNFTSWPEDGEIDIMEEVGYHKDYVSSSLHATGHVHSNGTQVTHEMYCKGAEGEFHTYAMEWTPEYIQTYVDGKKQLYYKDPGTGKRDWPYNTPFYPILNLAWGGDWGGSQGVDESALPVSMRVDYIRVWQK